MKLRLVPAGLLLAGALTGCSGFEINEALCSKGEEPVWAFSNRVGAQCVKDGESPPPGFARYPRDRVPVWINPPASYPHRTPDGDDRYNINPNNVDYPWWDEVVAEHPEFACDETATPSGEIPLGPRGGQAPRVTVLTNSVDNRCFRFDWPSSLGSVESAELVVRERGWPEPWSRTATDDASAKELLRVASDTCLRVTADSGSGSPTARSRPTTSRTRGCPAPARGDAGPPGLALAGHRRHAVPRELRREDPCQRNPPTSPTASAPRSAPR